MLIGTHHACVRGVTTALLNDTEALKRIVAVVDHTHSLRHRAAGCNALPYARLQSLRRGPTDTIELLGIGFIRGHDASELLITWATVDNWIASASSQAQISTPTSAPTRSATSTTNLMQDNRARHCSLLTQPLTESRDLASTMLPAVSKMNASQLF